MVSLDSMYIICGIWECSCGKTIREWISVLIPERRDRSETGRIGLVPAFGGDVTTAGAVLLRKLKSLLDVLGFGSSCQKYQTLQMSEKSP